MGEWLLHTFREYPSIALFLTIGVGFWIGQLKYKTFSLGTVTSVLLVGVLVGQMDISIPGPIKSVFFLLFLFAIGFSVGPQFFQALRGNGIKQVIFAVILCVVALLVTVVTAKIMGYNVGETAGLFAGAQTISAVIGVAGDMIPSLGASAADTKEWVSIIPVCYAVTYIFGTIGSAYILGNLGPAMLGGLKKVKEQTAQLAAQMNESELSQDPAYINANRPVVFRAYRADGNFFENGGKTVSEIHEYMHKTLGRRIFIERIRQNGTIIDNPKGNETINKGDEVVLSGRRAFVIMDESWIGQEVNDPQLLSFAVQNIDIILTRKGAGKMTVDQLRSQPWMCGIVIARITRAGVEIPVLAKTQLCPGDIVSVSGLAQEVNEAGPRMGYVDRPTTSTSLILLGFGIFFGALVGAITLTLKHVPLSLSTSGGALISGLVCGWLRSRYPGVGNIPKQSLWLLNNLGLNMFIAVIGITAGPTFVTGIQQVGWLLFVAGIIATTLPLLIGIWMGARIFKFHPAINLGCCAGSRTTTAALGAIQESLGSTIPAMGYTVTYAIGNTLLILWGVVIVLLMA